MPEPQRYAVVENGIVINVVLWDGTTTWQPPEGATLVRSDTLGTGDVVE